MQTLHLIATHFLATATPPPAPIAPLTSSSVNVANVQTITDNIRLFLGPIVLLIISAISISFLMKKQMKKFLEFIGLTMAVGVLFYVPGIVENIARSIAGLFGN